MEFAQTSLQSGSPTALAYLPAVVIALVVTVFYLACVWRIFTKAGEAGWKSLIPIYNYMVLAEIAGRPLWWGLLILIPFAGIVFIVIIYVDLARSFGQGAGFAVGLILLGFIFLPILAFGSSRYAGPAGRYPPPGQAPRYSP